MKKASLILLFFLCLAWWGKAQDTLFDPTRVSSVYIEISQDSLDAIFQDVYSDHYYGARFIYDYGTGRDTVEQAGFRLRGNTSRVSQKKSFKISFNEYVQGRRYRGVKKLNFNGQHNDPTLIREKLFYDAWSRAGLPERRTSFVRLYINQAYYGLYTSLEEFDKDWLQRVYGENDGNLYKCTYPANLDYHGTDQQYYKNIGSSSATGGRAYDLQTNESADDYSGLVQLIYILNEEPDSAFALEIESILNVDGVLKAFALDVATGNWDDYMYNQNNYFLYQNAATGKFDFITYDTDNTFGVDWVNRDWATRNCLDWYKHDSPRPLASKLLSVPDFANRYRCFLDTISRLILEPDSVFPHIDSLKALILPAVEEDTYRTMDYGYTMEDFVNGFTGQVDSHTPYGIKPFLELRQMKTLEQLAANSVKDALAGKGNTFTAYPNPAGEYLNLSNPGRIFLNRLIISDLSGQELFRLEPAGKQKTLRLDISGLPAGIYLLSGFSEKGSFSLKFIRR